MSIIVKPERANQLLDKACYNDLRIFTQRAFHTVDPGAEYLHNWHVDCMAEHLMACEKREISRLIINVPPRYLKSIAVSVSFPAWLMGRNPSEKILAASYSSTLSTKHSMDCRFLMQSEWYQRCFPDLHFKHDENQKTRFSTTKQGHRIATSVTGGIVGEGGNFLIVDDPHNPLQAASDIQRVTALEWFDQSFSTRLNNKKKGVIIVVMQRLHTEDLTGHLIEKGGWHHLCLPATAPTNKIIQIGKFKKEIKVGDILHEEREGKKELDKVKTELGSYGYSGQYQQVPTPMSGGMVEMDWFGRYTKYPEGGIIRQSWDTAIKDGVNNDFSVCTTWLETNNKHYLIDVVCEKLQYSALKSRIILENARHETAAILIEDKASGQSLLQDLRSDTKLPVIGINPTSDKVVRFAAVTAMIEAGRVILPENAKWLSNFESEISNFPLVPNDDQVDSVSQYLNWVKSKAKITPSIRSL